MPFLDIIATSAFGLESIVVRELNKLGVEKTEVENGRISFQGDYNTIVKSNIWLRCADRVLIKLASFRAYDFEDLFQGTLFFRKLRSFDSKDLLFFYRICDIKYIISNRFSKNALTLSGKSS